jgi:sulfoxide reductase heme-binding subunit YedZ
MNPAAPIPAQLRAIEAFLFLACLLPIARLAVLGLTDGLGANPIEFLQRSLGSWTLNFLLITLAVTPLRKLSGWHWIGRLRRMLGLFSFLYACLHFLNWLVLDQFFDWAAVGRDIAKRPYITVGFVAFVLLVPLAATSNNTMVRHLGGRRWRELHRTVYAIAILGVVHYWWLAKKGVTTPAIYAVALTVLLGLRLFWREQERRRQLAGGYAKQSIRHSEGSVVRFMRRRK